MLSRGGRSDAVMNNRAPSRAALVAVAVAAALAACAGWEGPGGWLQEAFVVGQPASACATAGDYAQGEYPAEHVFNTSFANWSGRVRAQHVECSEHTDPLNISKAAWVECRVEGPALVMHSPPIAGAETFVVGAGVFDLRATRSGMSCKPVEAQ
jgi:hypothetical protein